jgi:16S rRNA (cytosine1402-N4)-methyltransferase
VSSHHFDEAERGFAFRLEGNLDMRMNQRIATTAADVLNTYPAEDLQQIFRQFGELKDSRRITKKIIEKRSFKPFHHTFDLTEALQMFAPGKSQNKFFAKIFQALRIEVNQELEVLKQMLIQSTEALNNGGRMVIISYHSLEDRIVKNFFKSGNFEGILNKDFYGNIIAPFKQVSRKVITPTEEEQERNPRSRSAKMRIAEKTEYHAG